MIENRVSKWTGLPNRKHFNVTLPPDLIKLLKSTAKRENISVSYLIEKLSVDYIVRSNKKRKQSISKKIQ